MEKSSTKSGSLTGVATRALTITNGVDWYWLYKARITDAIKPGLYADAISMGNNSLAKIKLALASHVMKEHFGWSNEVLLQQCRSDFRVRHALGLSPYSDELPESSLLGTIGLKRDSNNWFKQQLEALSQKSNSLLTKPALA